MSQPASPIGSVEFIVKFESLQGSFVNALKQAFEDVDLKEIGMGDPKKLDEILFNLRARIRQPFTGDRLNFLMEAQPHKTFFEEKKTRDLLQQWFVSEDVGKRMLPRGEEEEPEAYKERLEKTVDSFMDGIVNMIEKGIDDPHFWKKHNIDFVDISAGFTAAVQGNWNYLMRNVFTKVIKEHELEKIGRDAARAGAFEHIWTPAGQKRTSQIKAMIGIEEEGKTKIEDYGQFIEAMMEILSKEKFQQELEKEGAAVPGMSPEERQAFLDKFYVDIGVEIPNIFAKAFGVEYGSGVGEFHLRDLPMYIWGQEGKAEYEKWIKSFGIVNEKKFDEWMTLITERIDAIGGTAATLEGKRFVTESAEAEAKEKYKGLLGMFGMMGTPLVQVIPEFETKTAKEVREAIEKALKEKFGETLKSLLEIAEVNSDLLDDFVKAIKEKPDLIETIGKGP